MGWTTQWPDWRDAGRRVELDLGDGYIQGELFVEDFFPDGDGGECPVFGVRADDQVEHSFASHERWRYV